MDTTYKKEHCASLINELIKHLSNNEFCDTNNISDSYLTFGDLYQQRLCLSAALFNAYSESCWKSRFNSDGTKVSKGERFIACCDTPQGPYTLSCAIKYWELFKVPVLDKYPMFDCTNSRDVTRLLSLTSTSNNKDRKTDKDTIVNSEVVRTYPNDNNKLVSFLKKGYLVRFSNYIGKGITEYILEKRL